MTSRLAMWISLTGAMLLASCGPAPSHSQSDAKQDESKTAVVTIAAASDLKFALEEVITEFQTQHADLKLLPTFGSSGNLFAQISNGAPFDLFLSADIEFPRQLIAQQLAIAESEFPYAVGHLVVWVHNDSALDVQNVGMEILKDPAVRKIAIANPKTAPYGRAAQAVLQHFGLEDLVQDRLVLGENIAQTAQFVESGAADVGIIALSLALAPAMKDKGRYWPVPLDAHATLLQGGVILTNAKHRAACGLFRSFLLSAPGRDILRRYGFEQPGE